MLFRREKTIKTEKLAKVLCTIIIYERGCSFVIAYVINKRLSTGLALLWNLIKATFIRIML